MRAQRAYYTISPLLFHLFDLRFYFYNYYFTSFYSSSYSRFAYRLPFSKIRVVYARCARPVSLNHASEASIQYISTIPIETQYLHILDYTTILHTVYFLFVFGFSYICLLCLKHLLPKLFFLFTANASLVTDKADI
jgi:hypothetical protein